MSLFTDPCVDPENFVRGVFTMILFAHQCISQGASRNHSIQKCICKTIATFDFPGEARFPVPTLDPRMDTICLSNFRIRPFLPNVFVQLFK